MTMERKTPRTKPETGHDRFLVNNSPVNRMFILPQSFDALELLPPKLHKFADDANYLASSILRKTARGRPTIVVMCHCGRSTCGTSSANESAGRLLSRYRLLKRFIERQECELIGVPVKLLATPEFRETLKPQDFETAKCQRPRETL